MVLHLTWSDYDRSQKFEHHDMILEIRSMMKSRKHFTYPSKICRENGVVPKGYYKGMMILIKLVVLCTPTYWKKKSVSLNATKDGYIAAKKNESKDSSSNEEYDPKELY